MNNPVHVQVQVVELHAVRVRSRDVDGHRDPGRVDAGLFLDDVNDCSRVPVGEPSVERWNTHNRQLTQPSQPPGDTKFDMEDECQRERKREGSRSVLVGR